MSGPDRLRHEEVCVEIASGMTCTHLDAARAAAPPVDDDWTPIDPAEDTYDKAEPSPVREAGLRGALRYLRGLSDDLAGAVLSGVRLDGISDADWDAATEGFAALLADPVPLDEIARIASEFYGKTDGPELAEYIAARLTDPTGATDGAPPRHYSETPDA